MKNVKKKGFTLIELIAVLVIMVIIVLIVTPLVMNIIRRARIAADKRSIDAYGRSIEYAIASYLLDNGRFPSDISDLTIEYSGNEVVCSHAQLNSDSSVYLAGCTVGGRTVDYAYGSDKSPSYTAYSIGDEVTYNNVDYYVLADSGTNESTVTLLKAEPLTVDEVNLYGGVGTENNHVNMYVTSDTNASYYQTAYNNNGYGGMAYYSSVNCGYNGTDWVFDGCTNGYVSSEVKYVVDAWKTSKAPSALEARLISMEEYILQCEEEEYHPNPSDTKTRYVPRYDWMYNGNYRYWTFSPYTDSVSCVWSVYDDGNLQISYVSNLDVGYYSHYGVVRPVITISKSALN